MVACETESGCYSEGLYLGLGKNPLMDDCILEQFVSCQLAPVEVLREVRSGKPRTKQGSTDVKWDRDGA